MTHSVIPVIGLAVSLLLVDSGSASHPVGSTFVS